MAKNTTKDGEQEPLKEGFKNHNNQNTEELLREIVIIDNKPVEATHLFIDKFKSLVDDIEEKVNKELEKPKYRFIDTVFTADEAEKLINNIIRERELFEQYGYSVEILNDIECTDVSKESKYTIRISKLDGAFVDIDLLEYQENIKDFTFDELKFIAEKIARIEGCINKRTKYLADIIADYLGFIMHFKVLYTLIYKKIGWYKYNYISDKYMWIFKYDRVYSKMQDMSQYITGRCMRGYIDGIEEKEDNEARDLESEWLKTTVYLVNKYDYDSLILGAGISGLVRQLLPYTKESNININIVGKPASGKSTICHYILGIFGNPEMLEGSFTDTDNKMEENRAKRPILPYVLDERMLKIESESDQAKKRILLMNIFREYEGKAKEKVGKQYEDISGERTYGPIISSSVRSMMDYIIELDDLGQFRRFIELDVGGRDEKKLFSSADEASEIERIAYDNYGFGIRIICQTADYLR